MPKPRSSGHGGATLVDASDQDCLTPAVLTVVQTALQQTHLRGLTEVLRATAEACGANGAIFWETEPDGQEEPGYLYGLAEWFDDEISRTLHDLPLDGSLCGRSVREQQVLDSPDILKDPRVRSREKLAQQGVRAMCAAPLQLPEGRAGCLSLYYWQRHRMSRVEKNTVASLATLLPALYQAIRDRASYRLLQDVNGLLDSAERRAGFDFAPKGKIREVLQAVCTHIQEAFGALEVTVHLEDSRNQPDLFERFVTTWPERLMTEVYSREYNEGLTAWTLAFGRELRIFDLRHFERDLPSLVKRYPELRWTKLSHIETAVRKKLGLEPDAALPAMSFMSSPILDGDRVVGALRCFAAAKEGPRFSSREHALLHLLAQEIGQRWGRWLTSRNLEEEIRSWQTLVRSVAQLNQVVQEDLSRKGIDQRTFLQRAVDVTQEVIPGAEIGDVRLVDETGKFLKFVVFAGELWDRGTDHEIAARKGRTFPLEPPAGSAGAKVFLDNEATELNDVSKDKYYGGTFLDTRRMIIAPISVQDDVYGVLDIRSTSSRAFPPYALSIAELLGQQLGLYLFLAKNIQQLERLKEEQKQAFQDLAHQVRSPLFQAHQRVKDLIAQASTRGGSDLELRKVRGLVAKAVRVAMSTRLFVDLARHDRIEAHPEPVSQGFLIPLLLEAAQDTEIIIERSRNIRIDIDRGRFESLDLRRVRVDHKLLEQALYTILDNAAKYSYPSTVIRVHGGVSARGHFHISVENQGIPLSPQEAKLARERGWRGMIAEQSTGEGSGLGLYIVDRILKAHGGELRVQPTNSKGWTLVEMLFPPFEGEPR